MAEEQKSEINFAVVVNHEEQYSIWPVDRKVPLGWKALDVTGPKEQCLAYIKEVWTDMRPLSLRKKMDADQQKCPSRRELCGASGEQA